MRKRIAGVGIVLALVAAVAAPSSGAKPAKAPRYLFAASFASNAVTVFNADTYEKVATIPTEVNAACCTYATPDGKKVFVVAGFSPWVTKIDVRTLSIEKQTQMYDANGEVADGTESGSPVTNDGKNFWVTGTANGESAWGLDVASGKVHTFFHGTGRDFQGSHDGKVLYFFVGGDKPPFYANHLVVRSAKTGNVISDKLAITGTRGLLSPDDKTLYIQTGPLPLPTGQTEKVEVVDVSDRAHPRLITTMPLPGAAYYGAISPDGKYLWVPGADDGHITIFNLKKNKVEHTINLGVYGVGVVISENGKAYVSVTDLPPVRGGSAALHVAGVAPGAELGIGNGPTGPPGEIWVYDAKTFKRLDTPEMKLPSSSFGPSIIERAPRFVPGKLTCTSPDSLWVKDVGCIPPN